MRIKLKEEFYEFLYADMSDIDFVGIVENYDEVVITFLKENFKQDVVKNLEETITKHDKDAEILEVTEEIEKNWNEDWEKSVQAIIVSDRIAITPSWKANEVSAPMKIIIDPKMSFGTGSHSTTLLMCRLAEKFVTRGSSWIDAGTGTGILAILASKLGAESVFAFDNNEWSVDNTKENIALNDANNIIVEMSDLHLIELPDSSGIFANLFIHLIIPSLPKFKKALTKSRGVLIVSGVLKYDEALLLNAAESGGFTLIEKQYHDEWIAAAFKLKGV